jgi:D-glycero-D-manno-heptose 1,7-bisphosphate phosphatase
LNSIPLLIGNSFFIIVDMVQKIRLIIFDIDGTLTEIKPETLTENPGLVTPNRLGEQQPRQGVTEKLSALREIGVQFALATNRGGVAWGYTSLEEAYALAKEAAEMCGIPDAALYLCPYHAKARGPKAIMEYSLDHECRKPRPGMLLQAMEEAGVSAEETVFVGDNESDRQAAEAAEVGFFWADEFFEMEDES